MITLIVSLFLGASFATSIALIAACILSGRMHKTAEAESAMISVEALRSMAEVELPKYRARRRYPAAHAGI